MHPTTPRAPTPFALTVVFCASLAALASGACAPSDSPDSCPVGGEACMCTSGGTCDVGLTCASNTCVRLPTSPAASPTRTGSPDAGVPTTPPATSPPPTPPTSPLPRPADAGAPDSAPSPVRPSDAGVPAAPQPGDAGVPAPRIRAASPLPLVPYRIQYSGGTLLFTSIAGATVKVSPNSTPTGALLFDIEPPAALTRVHLQVTRQTAAQGPGIETFWANTVKAYGAQVGKLATANSQTWQMARVALRATSGVALQGVLLATAVGVRNEQQVLTSLLATATTAADLDAVEAEVLLRTLDLVTEPPVTLAALDFVGAWDGGTGSFNNDYLRVDLTSAGAFRLLKSTRTTGVLEPGLIYEESSGTYTHDSGLLILRPTTCANFFKSSRTNMVKDDGACSAGDLPWALRVYHKDANSITLVGLGLRHLYPETIVAPTLSRIKP